MKNLLHFLLHPANCVTFLISASFDATGKPETIKGVGGAEVELDDNDRWTVAVPTGARGPRKTKYCRSRFKWGLHVFMSTVTPCSMSATSWNVSDLNSSESCTPPSFLSVRTTLNRTCVDCLPASSVCTLVWLTLATRTSWAATVLDAMSVNKYSSELAEEATALPTPWNIADCQQSAASLWPRRDPDLVEGSYGTSVTAVAVTGGGRQTALCRHTSSPRATQRRRNWCIFVDAECRIGCDWRRGDGLNVVVDVALLDTNTRLAAARDWETRSRSVLAVTIQRVIDQLM